MPKRHAGVRPLCACGCGQRVKRWSRRPGRPTRYFSVACVPKEIRRASARKARQRYAYRIRSAKFSRLIDRILEDGGRITRGGLFEALMSAYTLGRGATRQAAKRARQSEQVAA